MPMFRKKPVVIEAYQLPESNETPTEGLVAWLHKMDEKWESEKDGCLVIHTLEGDHLAMPGDYIIKGVHGEYYPCKPDIFAKTYEEVDG